MPESITQHQMLQVLHVPSSPSLLMYSCTSTEEPERLERSDEDASENKQHNNYYSTLVELTEIVSTLCVS